MPMHDWANIGAYIYQDFHGEWIYAIRRVLNNGVLPAGDYAMAGQVTRTIGPDVLTLQSRTGVEPLKTDPSEGRAGPLALSDTPPRVRSIGATRARPPRFRQRRVTIRHSSSDRLVAIIELVSPGNKSSKHAFQKFVSKIVRAVDAGIHALVVDPFPPGNRDPNGIHAAIWSELGGESYPQPADFSLTQVAYESPDASSGEPRYYHEPLGVGQPLAEMPLFLQPGYYVNVPLERSYQDAFADVLPQHRALLEPTSAS